MSRVIAEEPTSSLLILDGRRRSVGTPNNFVTDLKSQIEGVRRVKLTRVIMSKLPTINSKNDQIIIEINKGGPITLPQVTLQHGYYNQVSFINELQRAFTVLGNASLPHTTFKITYDTRDTSITIANNNGYKWYFVSKCSFIQYGINVAHFEHHPIAAGVNTFGSDLHHSSHIGMIYSRYVTISSAALTSNERSFSRGAGFGQTGVIGVAVEVDHYDFNTEGRFDGSYMSQDITIDAPTINYLKTGRDPLPSQIDIQVRDEFGFDVDDVLDITALTAEINQNLSCCCFIKLFF